MATTSLYDLFRQSVDRFPLNAAVLWCSDTCRLSLSYNEVLKECADIAGAIGDASSGVGGQFVGVLMSSADLCLPSAVLGILREGLAFVFLGPDNLRGDGASVLRRLEVRLVLTNVNAADRDANVASLKGASGWKRGEVATREDSVEVWELPPSSPGGAAFPAVGRSLAYAIQTSGTLGEPKTVRVPHSAIVPNILDLGCELQVVPEDVMVLRTPLTFDPSVVELFLPLSRGASVMLVPPSLRNSPSFLLSSPATLLQTMPSLLLRWSPNLNLAGSSLRAVLLGGEPFPPPQILPIGGHHEVRLYNLYGITEVSCWATVHRVDELDRHPVPLGRPLSGTVLEVRDPGGAAISSGEGEAFIGSSERVCYLDDESELSGMVFRATGDTVKVEGGACYYVGRCDRTVKCWGQRVQLGRLEEEALLLPSVAACAATFYHHHPGGGKLVLAVVWEGGVQQPEDTALYRHLSERLPASFLPDEVVPMEEIPLTDRGKIHYRTLEKDLADRGGGQQQGTMDPLLPAELWRRYTGVSPSPGDNFLEAGGSSLLAVQLATQLVHRGEQQHLSVAEVATLLLSKGSTFGDLEKLLAGPPSQSVGGLAPSVQVGGPGGGDDTRVRVVSVCSLGTDCPLLRGQSLELSCRQGSARHSEDGKLCSGGDSGTPALKPSWQFDLKKCVDASPLLAVYQGCEPLVLVGSHSGLVAAVHGESGQVHLVVQLPDRVESGVCVSACGRYAVVGCYDGRVYCFDIDTGSQRWSFITGDMVKSSPVLSSSGDEVLVGSYDHLLYCISLKTGERRWSARCGDGSVYATACASEGLVFTGSLDGTCCCVSEDNGHTVWSQKLASPIFSSPVLVRSGKAVLFTEVAGVVHCLAAGSGVELWTFKAGGNVFSTPCVWSPPPPGDCCDAADLVAFGCHDGKVYCLSCSSTGGEEKGKEEGSEPKLAWCTPVGSAVFSTPSVVVADSEGGGGLLAVATTAGELLVLNAGTGSQLCSHRCPGEVFSSPVLYGGSVYVGCRDNNVYCLKVSFDSGRVLMSTACEEEKLPDPNQALDLCLQQDQAVASESPYQCLECDKAFPSQGRLNGHMRRHTGERPYRCPECSQRFPKSYNLAVHMRTHTGEKPYSCPRCARTFSTLGHLTTHVRTHTKEKPYRCGACEASFSQLGTLYKHVRTHTGEKPYTCGQCRKAFSRSDNLAVHARTHARDGYLARRHRCGDCGKAFSQAGALAKHLRAHGQQPFLCVDCDRSFSRSDKLAMHMRTHITSAT